MASNDYTVGAKDEKSVIIDLNVAPTDDLVHEIGMVEPTLVPIIISNGEMKPLLKCFGGRQFALVDKNFVVAHCEKQKYAKDREQAIELAKGLMK